MVSGVFSSHVLATHTNALFPANSFSMSPNFAVTHISGWHLSFPHGLAGRRFPSEGACKSHPPFNLHTFRLCPSPPGFPSIFGCPVLPVSMVCGILPNRPKQGQKGAGRSVYPLFQTRPQITTWMTTGDNKTFLLPIRPPQFHSSKGLEGYCRIYRNKK